MCNYGKISYSSSWSEFDRVVTATPVSITLIGLAEVGSLLQVWFTVPHTPLVCVMNNIHMIRNHYLNIIWKQDPTKKPITPIIYWQEIKKRCGELSSSDIEDSLWSLAKNISHKFCQSPFSPLFTQDGDTALPLRTKQICLPDSSLLTLQRMSLTYLNLKSLIYLTVALISIYPSKLDRILIQVLKPKKAYGMDGGPPRVLNGCVNILSTILACPFQCCISYIFFPASWRHDLVHPIPNKGTSFIS